ncbi:PEP-CTERM sorting domain-containing protein [Thiobacillus sedimenti]|uniref:PEP-CTERM sorting domain-containing protein n=1 Tax=Thiobacillus sedimenti TaxID=3110231 RepID=A0ABZ1CIX3_9PROT|nr:PEP-CTERM sorting domain-containing protein [Thiobacillus sp. SCUT-2]WRS38905.1 PEP-CTERM sorting domain-containing protein [Thiobacillus sp. SCUT-2]
MRTLLSVTLLSLVATPSFAIAVDAVSVPEPGILGLIGIGAAALLVGRRKK